MSRGNNFLIGNGERLISTEALVERGNPKKLPYTFEEAKDRLTFQIEGIIKKILEMPESTKPNNETVIAVTLHPRYVSRTDHPSKFLEQQSLTTVGSKSRYIKPENWGTKEKPPEEPSLTDMYYIKTSIPNLSNLLHNITDLVEDEINNTICYLESFNFLSSVAKFQGDIHELDYKEKVVIECVLHNNFSESLLPNFFEFLNEVDNNIDYKESKTRSVGSLRFVPIITHPENLEKIGQFGFLRAFRRMPELRPFRPSPLRNSIQSLVDFPKSVLLNNLKVVIFDGGLPLDVTLPDYINYVEMMDSGDPVEEYVQHGLAVTSAYLFGHITDANNLQPLSNVTHVRVLGQRHTDYSQMNSIEDLYLYDVVDNIITYMELENPDLVNISLGPDRSVEDDEVTYWTAEIDNYVAKNDVLITVAAGNNGNESEIGNLHRIQIPSDGVNILSVGAADCDQSNWRRASYSAMGPGRNPGLVKPDIIAFGGSSENLFHVLDTHQGKLVLNKQQGTSFAAPLVMRHAAFIKGSFGSNVTNMTIRALLIHHADKKSFAFNEVGWGKCHSDMNYAITCNDNEVTAIYKGELAIGSYTRLTLPLQNINFDGKVNIKATVVSRTDVDPDYAASYTKGGFEIVFRPNDQKYNDGGQHPVSKPFFPQAKFSSKSETLMKAQGAKWECVRKDNLSLNRTSLSNPVFDLRSHHRNSGQDEITKLPIEFVCVITVSCAKSKDLYNEVIRQYRGILNPLIPQQTIQISLF